MKHSIYLLLHEGVGEELDIEGLRDGIEEEFSLPTKVLPFDLDPEPYYDPARGQYHSTQILKEILHRVPEDALKALGIVSFDLFIPILTFVFGEAQLDGKAALVSLARLRQEFYGLPPNQRLLERRLLKEAKHELGHTFGLVHCPIRECVMSMANRITDVDAKGLTFCEGCRQLLLEALKRSR